MSCEKTVEVKRKDKEGEKNISKKMVPLSQAIINETIANVFSAARRKKKEGKKQFSLKWTCEEGR